MSVLWSPATFIPTAWRRWSGMTLTGRELVRARWRMPSSSQALVGAASKREVWKVCCGRANPPLPLRRSPAQPNRPALTFPNDRNRDIPIQLGHRRLQSLHQPGHEVRAAAHLGDLDILVGLVGLVDPAGAAEDDRKAALLELSGFGGIGNGP